MLHNVLLALLILKECYPFVSANPVPEAISLRLNSAVIAVNLTLLLPSAIIGIL